MGPRSAILSIGGEHKRRRHIPQRHDQDEPQDSGEGGLFLVSHPDVENEKPEIGLEKGCQEPGVRPQTAAGLEYGPLLARYEAYGRHAKPDGREKAHEKFFHPLPRFPRFPIQYKKEDFFRKYGELPILENKVSYLADRRFPIDNSRVLFRLMRRWPRPPDSTCLGEKDGKKNRSALEEDPVKEEAQIREILLELFSSQKLGVLGTHQAGQPYGSLVAFAATPDLKSLVFATTRATRKFANLRSDPRVSMVLDNRSNRVADFRKAVAATALGQAKETKGKERKKFRQNVPGQAAPPQGIRFFPNVRIGANPGASLLCGLAFSECLRTES